MFFEQLESRYLLNGAVFDIIEYSSPIVIESNLDFSKDFSIHQYSDHRAYPISMPISDYQYSVGSHIVDGYLPFGSKFWNNSSVMLGSIYVNVILFESDGSIDSNLSDWAFQDILRIKNSVIEAMEWWYITFKNHFPDSKHSLTFIVDFSYLRNPIETGYEFAGNVRPANFYGDLFLEHIGYGSFRTYNFDQRKENGTDFSTAFIIVNDNFIDGKQFERGSFAFLGGSYSVAFYNNRKINDGSFPVILAHEFAHLFGALDEYHTRHFTYHSFSGYYKVQNTNAAYDRHPASGPQKLSLMSNYTSMIESYGVNVTSTESMQMIGWRDSNSNGIFDIYDNPISFNINLKDAYGLTFDFSFKTEGLLSTWQFPREYFIADVTVDILQIKTDSSWLDLIYFEGIYENESSFSLVDSYNSDLYFRVKNVEFGIVSEEIKIPFYEFKKTKLSTVD